MAYCTAARFSGRYGTGKVVRRRGDRPRDTHSGRGEPDQRVTHTRRRPHQARAGGCPVSDAEERRLLTPEEYRAAQGSPEFTELKRRFRRFAFPMTVAFFTWY